MSYPTKTSQPKTQLITIKCKKNYYRLILYPKTWLSRVQTSKVLQLIQKKTQVSNELVSRIEQEHNYGEESLLRWKQLPDKSPRNLRQGEGKYHKVRASNLQKNL